METVVVVLMILVCFNFMMKQTFRKRGSVAAIAVVATLFVGLMWPYAIQQSKTQIADWLANVQLMLDTSVVLTVEVALQMAFCMLAVHVLTTGPVKKRTLLAYRALRWFPGILIFPVLFSGLVYLIFFFSGCFLFSCRMEYGGRCIDIDFCRHIVSSLSFAGKGITVGAIVPH